MGIYDNAQHNNYPAPLKSKSEWLEEMNNMYNEAKTALTTAEFYNFSENRLNKVNTYTALAQAAAMAAQAAS